MTCFLVVRVDIREFGEEQTSWSQVCYLGLDHSWPLVPQVLQSGCNINLLGTCQTHKQKQTHEKWCCIELNAQEDNRAKICQKIWRLQQIFFLKQKENTFKLFAQTPREMFGLDGKRIWQKKPSAAILEVHHSLMMSWHNRALSLLSVNAHCPVTRNSPVFRVYEKFYVFIALQSKL